MIRLLFAAAIARFVWLPTQPPFLALPEVALGDDDVDRALPVGLRTELRGLPRDHIAMRAYGSRENVRTVNPSIYKRSIAQGTFHQANDVDRKRVLPRSLFIPCGA